MQLLRPRSLIRKTKQKCNCHHEKLYMYTKGVETYGSFFGISQFFLSIKNLVAGGSDEYNTSVLDLVIVMDLKQEKRSDDDSKGKTLIDLIRRERAVKALSASEDESHPTYDTCARGPDTKCPASRKCNKCKTSRRYALFVRRENLPMENEDLDRYIAEILEEPPEISPRHSKMKNRRDLANGSRITQQLAKSDTREHTHERARLQRVSEWCLSQGRQSYGDCSKNKSDGVSSPSQITVETKGEFFRNNNGKLKTGNKTNHNQRKESSSSSISDHSQQSSPRACSRTPSEQSSYHKEEETHSLLSLCRSTLTEEKEASDDFLKTIKSWQKSNNVRYYLPERSFDERGALQRWMKSKKLDDKS